MKKLAYEVIRIHSDEKSEKVIATFTKAKGFNSPLKAARLWAKSEALSLSGEFRQMGKDNFASVYYGGLWTVSYHVVKVK